MGELVQGEKPKKSWRFVLVLVLLGVDAVLTLAGVQVGTSVPVSSAVRAFDVLIDVGAIVVLALGFAWGWWVVVSLTALTLVLSVVPYIDFVTTFGRFPPELVGAMLAESLLPGITLRLLFRIRAEVSALDAWRKAQAQAGAPTPSGTVVPLPAKDAPARLAELRALKDQGLISDVDFEDKKAAIIKEL